MLNKLLAAIAAKDLSRYKSNREKEIIAYNHYCGYSDPKAYNKFKKIKASFWLRIHKYYDDLAMKDFLNS